MNKLWDVINEGGEGYRPVKAHVRSADEIESNLNDLRAKLENAKTDYEYNPGDDAAAYRVRSLPAKIAALEHELAQVRV